MKNLSIKEGLIRRLGAGALTILLMGTPQMAKADTATANAQLETAGIEYNLEDSVATDLIVNIEDVYKKLGSLETLKEVEDMEGVSVYPYINFGVVNKYQESFGTNHYNTRNVIGEIITVYPYDLQSNVWDKKAQKINIISPRYYQAFAQSLADSYASVFKLQQEGQILSNISLDSIGSVLTGDYRKNKEMFKINAVYEQIKSLEMIKEAGVTDINLYRPYDYAFPYVSNAKEIKKIATNKTKSNNAKGSENIIKKIQ